MYNSMVFVTDVENIYTEKQIVFLDFIKIGMNLQMNDPIKINLCSKSTIQNSIGSDTVNCLIDIYATTTLILEQYFKKINY